MRVTSRTNENRPSSLCSQNEPHDKHFERFALMTNNHSKDALWGNACVEDYLVHSVAGKLYVTTVYLLCKPKQS